MQIDPKITMEVNVQNKHIKPLNIFTSYAEMLFNSCIIDWCGIDGFKDTLMSDHYCLRNDYCRFNDSSGCNLTFDMCVCRDTKAGGGADLEGCSNIKSDIPCSQFNDIACRTSGNNLVSDASFCGPFPTRVDDITAI